MGDMSELQAREEKLQGMGTSLLRKEGCSSGRAKGGVVAGWWLFPTIH